MPKILRADETDNISLSPRKVKALEVLNKLKIEEHFVSSRCLTCHAPTLEGKVIAIPRIDSADTL